MASTVKPNRRPFPRCFTTAGKKTPARLARRGDTTRERSRNATNERHIGAYSFSFREGIATRDRAESSLNETPCAACENRKQTQREREREQDARRASAENSTCMQKPFLQRRFDAFGSRIAAWNEEKHTRALHGKTKRRAGSYEYGKKSETSRPVHPHLASEPTNRASTAPPTDAWYH